MSLLLPPLPPTFDAALRDVTARRVEMRLAAAKRLAEPEAEREDEARAALFRVVEDRDARVRGQALLGLGRIGGKDALPRLEQALDDEHPAARELAVIALVELGEALGSETVRGALRAALESTHPEVRFQAAAGYAVAGEPASELIPRLDDQDRRVRAAAALSLAQLGDARGGAILGQETLYDPELAAEALEALGSLGLREYRDGIAELAERVLIPLSLKAGAGRALLRLQDTRGVSALRSVLRAFRGEARSYAVEVVGEQRVHALAAELRRLSRRPRGADPHALVDALAALAPESSEAREGLARMARRRDAAGERARELLDHN